MTFISIEPFHEDSLTSLVFDLTNIPAVCILLIKTCEIFVNGTVSTKLVVHLGRHGIYTGSSGLTVAYLSGVETSGSGGHEDVTNDAHFTAVDVDNLRLSVTGASQFRGVDLLLTSQWPRRVDKYAVAPVSCNNHYISSLSCNYFFENSDEKCHSLKI